MSVVCVDFFGVSFRFQRYLGGEIFSGRNFRGFVCSGLFIRFFTVEISFYFFISVSFVSCLIDENANQAVLVVRQLEDVLEQSLH